VRGRLRAVAFGSGLAALLLGAAELAGRRHEHLSFPTDQPGRGYATLPYAYGTNRHGFLERDLAPAPDPAVRRVAVLGDSMTYGTGTAAETYTRHAEAELGAPWQLLNFAQYGYDAAQSAATLRHHVWAYVPERIVYAAYSNDVVPTRLVRVGEPPQPASVGATPVFFPLWLRERSSLLRRIEGTALARTVTDAPDWEAFRAAVTDLRDQARDHGVALLVFQQVPHVAAGLDQGGCDARCQQALAITRQQEAVYVELGIPHASALPYLRGSGAAAFYPPNAADWEHPSPRGHAVLGRALADVVRRWEAGVELPGMDDASVELEEK
jgi:hypothetical protein